jgi:hypothetical protein
VLNLSDNLTKLVIASASEAIFIKDRHVGCTPRDDSILEFAHLLTFYTRTYIFEPIGVPILLLGRNGVRSSRHFSKISGDVIRLRRQIEEKNNNEIIRNIYLHQPLRILRQVLPVSSGASRGGGKI